MPDFKKYGKRLLQVLVLLTAGLCVGYGAYQGSKQLLAEKPSTSIFEAGKPYEPVKVSNQQEPIKPDVGPAVEAQSPPPELPVLVLGLENTLVFNEVVTDESVAKFMVKAQEMSNKLSPDKDIILVLYTPGGSVDAGMQLMDNLKALPQKVKTLTLFSASMGFQFVQNLDERMIIPSGVLMSHRASGGMKGEIYGEFDVRYNAVKRQIEYMDTIASRRMKITLDAYRTLIRDEYWVHGFEAVGDRAADKLVLARCGKDMVGTEDKTFDYMGTPIAVTFSKCPLITGPLDIKAANSANKDLIREAIGFTKLLYQDPKEFYKQFIETKKFEILLKKD